MLLLVFTVVEAPDAGWASARTLASFAADGRDPGRASSRSSGGRPRRWSASASCAPASLVQANLGAMTLIGGWFGFQFIATLYMQQLRGWSPLETGLAIFPGGLLVALLAPRIAPLVMRFGVTAADHGRAWPRPPSATRCSCRSGSTRRYAPAILPTMLFAGFGFALAYGPLNIAATNGVAPEEQGLASGLVNTSFQFGGALVLAVVTAVNNANTGADGSPAGAARRLPGRRSSSP